MNCIKDLSSAERLEIGILLEKRYSQRSIARALGRGHNTVSYEIAVNSTNGIYDPLKAEAKARLRKRMRKLAWAKINAIPKLRNFIVTKLKARWNPDELAGYLKKHSKECPWYASKTAIYTWLRTARGERYCKFLYSKRKRVKKRKPKTKREIIPNRVDLSQRPAGATNRSRYGHFEDDTIVGRKGTPGGLKSAQERKSKLVLACKVGSMRPAEHAEAERRIFYQKKVLSVTRDNGIENRDHEKLGRPSFFCDPYSSWQKGGVENANKMLRGFFPKGTDFREVTQAQVDQAVKLINEKPRKILGYRSAYEVALKAGIIKYIKSESVLTLG